MVHPLTASPWTPEETSHIMTESQPCLSALVQLIWFRSSMHWVKTACLLFLAELRIGSTDDPFSLFLEGWYLERKKLPSMTRDTFSGLLSDGSFSLLPPKKEHWRVPYESLSLAPVSPSPFITETPTIISILKGETKRCILSIIVLWPRGKKIWRW